VPCALCPFQTGVGTVEEASNGFLCQQTPLGETNPWSLAAALQPAYIPGATPVTRALLSALLLDAQYSMSRIGPREVLESLERFQLHVSCLSCLRVLQVEKEEIDMLAGF